MFFNTTFLFSRIVSRKRFILDSRDRQTMSKSAIRMLLDTYRNDCSELSWIDWDEEDQYPAEQASAVESNDVYLSPDAALGVVDGQSCWMLSNVRFPFTLLSEWFVTVELGLDLEEVYHEELLVGPSGEPLDLVGTLSSSSPRRRS